VSGVPSREDVLALTEGRCFATKRYALRCELRTRAGFVTCKRHADQEDLWFDYLSVNYRDYAS
jgi:hypothetical protein